MSTAVTTQAPTQPGEQPPLPPFLSFALANLKGSLKNKVMMAVALFTPAMLLIMFWLVSSAASDGDSDFNLMAFIFPGVVVFTVIQMGAMHATTIVNWREQKIFARLACTPVPLWQLVLGRSISQVVLSLIQAFIIILLGVLMLETSLTLGGFLIATLILTLASACFIALGTVIAGLSPNAVIANSVYVFLIVPLIFLGDTMMPAEIMPGFVQNLGGLLPTAMITHLIRPIFSEGVLPAAPLPDLVGLILYTLIFVVLSIRLFRWQ